MQSMHSCQPGKNSCGQQPCGVPGVVASWWRHHLLEQVWHGVHVVAPSSPGRLLEATPYPSPMRAVCLERLHRVAKVAYKGSGICRICAWEVRLIKVGPSQTHVTPHHRFLSLLPPRPLRHCRGGRASEWTEGRMEFSRDRCRGGRREEAAAVDSSAGWMAPGSRQD